MAEPASAGGCVRLRLSLAPRAAGAEISGGAYVVDQAEIAASERWISRDRIAKLSSHCAKASESLIDDGHARSSRYGRIDDSNR